MLFTSERSELLRDTVLMLENIECRILETLGEGTSCIVYKAQMPICIDGQTLQRTVVLKELYPKGLEIARNEDHSLDIPESSQEIFERYMSRFKRACQRQIELRNDAAMTNATTEIQHIYSLNNTLYSVMGIVTGNSYDQEPSEDLKTILNMGILLADYIAKCHDKGFLYLDIKPANIFKETHAGGNIVVKLFDFDTVVTREEAQKGDVSYSEGYAAPEVKKAKQGNGSYADIREQADLFSIGSVIFEKIMGRCSAAEDHSKGKRWDFSNNAFLRDAVPQLQKGITELFRKTLARNPNNRYASAQELKETLEKLMKLADIKVFLKKQKIAPCTPKSIYMARTHILSQIAEKLKENQLVYLYAIGGSGKSETAREFAEQYTKQYDFIQSVFYSGNLKKTIANLDFVGLKDEDRFAHTDEEIDRLYKYKYGLLGNTAMYGTNTLLIIDNYDYDSDPASAEYRQNTAIIHQMENLPIHVLFTTRRKPSDSTRCLDLLNLSPEELRELFFRINPTDKNDPDRIALVDEIIKASYYHTMTVKLVAMQSAKYRKPLSEYLGILTKSGLNSGIKGRLTNEKDGEAVTMSTVYEHIKALFDFEHLSEPQKYIMVNACLLPLSGLETGVFSDFIGLSGDCLDPDIEDLINSGWIEYTDTAESQLTAETKITLHPLIGDLVHNELQPDLTEEKCGKFYEAFLNLIDEWGNKRACGEDCLQQENRIYDLFPNTNAIHEDYHVSGAVNRIVISAAGISVKQHMLISGGEIISYFGNDKQLEIPAGLTSIGDCAFKFCDLTKITLPAGLTSIGKSAFSYCSSLSQITLPAGLTSIGEFAFCECSSLKHITIPKSVKEIEWGAFDGCSSLTQILLPAGLTSIGDSAFRDCSSLTKATIPNSVTSIGNSIFEGCSALTTVTLPAGLTSIEDHAFCECSALKHITIPKSVTEIEWAAFEGCSALKYITLPNSIRCIDESTFSNCSSLKYIIIPESVTEIGDYAFRGCSALEKIILFNPKIRIGHGTFDDCPLLDHSNLTDITVQKQKYRGDKHLTELVLPHGTTEIESDAFENCTSLTKIIIPTGVKKIGCSAFKDCSSLTEINLPDSVTEIEPWAFGGCSSLTQINIPDSVTEIGFLAFRDCFSLEEVTLPAFLTSIGDRAFCECSALKHITIPKSVTEIEWGAFKGCSALTSITIPDSVTSIESFVFSGCSALTRINIPNNVTLIKSHAFSGCSSLTQFRISDSVTKIGEAAFRGCSSLTQFRIPESLTEIGKEAFDRCKSLNLFVVLNREVDLSESLIGFYTDKNGLYRKKDDMTIKGYRNSTAEQYAQKNGFDFVPLD